MSAFQLALFLSFVSIPMLIFGCSPYRRTSLGTYDIPYDKLPKEIGPWANDYAGNPDLAGVIVNQYDEGPSPKAPYAHRHPASIWYVFWNGDVKAVSYKPDGTVIMTSEWNKFFDSRDQWMDVDFSYGSDPSFSDHSDPRL